MDSWSLVGEIRISKVLNNTREMQRTTRFISKYFTHKMFYFSFSYFKSILCKLWLIHLNGLPL